MDALEGMMDALEGSGVYETLTPRGQSFEEAGNRRDGGGERDISGKTNGWGGTCESDTLTPRGQRPIAARPDG
ncbi:hypothetical protein BIFGAL_04034 [Bifidobacterium gallicum DSM 20093 = LMG 11596]|uniref:Uncharacterized protein n=1 Tax=Bifidobacterium gallicum DSM 20093 = LMG 11596 TaxID=561180 RepID=D1NVZ0_9BIFI|nr:hypothetical protein BIFGAL_04034 [Bifidobacterium gallicum DSM 20093 = LMG 11596]